MIRLHVDDRAARQVRLGYSPLAELTAALRARARPADRHLPPALAVRGRLGSLLPVLVPTSGAFPGSLNPTPDLSGRRTIEDELHTVATGSGQAFRTEVEQVLAGNSGVGIPARRVAPNLRSLLDEQGDDLAAGVAEALAAYWQQTLAPRWSLTRDRLDADLDRCGRSLARGGLDNLLTGLDPRLRWRDNQLAVDKPYTEDLGAVTSLVLSPSVHLADTVLVTGSRHAPVRMIYPAYGRGQPVPQRTPAGIATLLGGTRARLLAALIEPTSTDALASMLGLAPSTVSYHLQVLHQAGLLERVRRGLRVRYSCSALGRALLPNIRPCADRPTSGFSPARPRQPASDDGS